VTTLLKGATLVEVEPPVVERGDVRVDKGRIVADGTPAELLAKSPTKRLDEVFRALTTPDADIKAEAMP
jgi:hypothetical protein